MVHLFAFDTWIPLLWYEAPILVVALVPVIAVEAYILFRELRLPLGSSLKVSAVANAVSTAVGVPLAYGYGALFPAHFYHGDFFIMRGWPTWVGLAAIPVLALPFFFLSWWLEYGVARLLLRRERTLRQLLTAEREANLYSYSLLVILTFTVLALP